MNPEVPYVESEKKTLNKIQDSQAEISEAEFCRLLNQEGSGPLRGVKNPAVESSEDLPGLVKPPSRPGQISFSEAEFSRLVNQDSRSRVEKPTVENSEDLPGLVKPPSRPVRSLPKVHHLSDAFLFPPLMQAYECTRP